MNDLIIGWILRDPTFSKSIMENRTVIKIEFIKLPVQAAEHEEFPIYLGIGELIEMSRHESGGVFY
jgi:hypothetical protein